MRRVQAILVILALLATPLALVARADDSGMAGCAAMCCLPHGPQHTLAQIAPASHSGQMSCHRGALGHMMECTMKSGPHRVQYGLVSPFPPASPSVIASIEIPDVSRIAKFRIPAGSLSSGFLANPFQPPRS